MKSLVNLPEKLSFWQVLNVPLSWRPECDFDKAQRAFRLTRRWEAETSRLLAREEKLKRKLAIRKDLRDDAKLMFELLQVRQQLSTLECLSPAPAVNMCRVVLSSEMMKTSFEYCTQDEREGLHFVLGIEHEGVRIGTQIRTFLYQVQSVVAAEGDLRATHKIAIDAHESGHVIVAMIHSHPGKGRGANRPSGIDMRTQRLMEHTMHCVGGIWARDGNLRLYGDKHHYEVEIVGNHFNSPPQNRVSAGFLTRLRGGCDSGGLTRAIPPERRHSRTAAP